MARLAKANAGEEGQGQPGPESQDLFNDTDDTTMEHSEVNKTVDLTEDDQEVIQLDSGEDSQQSSSSPKM